VTYHLDSSTPLPDSRECGRSGHWGSNLCFLCVGCYIVQVCRPDNLARCIPKANPLYKPVVQINSFEWLSIDHLVIEIAKSGGTGKYI